MKRLVFLFFVTSLLSGLAPLQGQTQFSVLQEELCWTTPGDVDSTIVRHSLVSSRDQTRRTMGYYNASAAPVSVSGGTLAFGGCCCQSGQGSTAALDSVSVLRDSITALRSDLGDVNWYVSNDTAYWVNSEGVITSYYLGSSGPVNVANSDSIFIRSDSIFITVGIEEVYIGPTILEGTDIVLDSVWKVENPAGDSLFYRISSGTIFSVRLDPDVDHIIAIRILDGPVCDTVVYVTGAGKGGGYVTCNYPPELECRDTFSLAASIISHGEPVIILSSNTVRQAVFGEIPHGFILEESIPGGGEPRAVVQMCGATQLSTIGGNAQTHWSNLATTAGDSIFYHTSGGVQHISPTSKRYPLYFLSGGGDSLYLRAMNPFYNSAEDYGAAYGACIDTIQQNGHGHTRGDLVKKTGISQYDIVASGETGDAMVLDILSANKYVISFCGEFKIADLSPNGQTYWGAFSDGQQYWTDGGISQTADDPTRPTVKKASGSLFHTNFFGFTNNQGGSGSGGDQTLATTDQSQSDSIRQYNVFSGGRLEIIGTDHVFSIGDAATGFAGEKGLVLDLDPGPGVKGLGAFRNNSDDAFYFMGDLSGSPGFIMSETTLQVLGLSNVSVSASSISMGNSPSGIVTINNVLRVSPTSAVNLSGITAVDGMIVYANTTDGTFTQVGFWKREAGVWVKF